MKKFKKNHLLGLLVWVLVLAAGCGGNAPQKPPREDVLNLRLEGPANIINPLLPSSGYARHMAQQVFLTLGTNDPVTLETKPYLAKSIPTATSVADGKYKGCLAYEFEINELATWDNGSPITAADVEFSFKIVFNPLLQTEVWRGFYEDVKGLEVDASNPRKFTVYMRQFYMLGLESLCQLPIYPAYSYDPSGHLRSIALNDLLDTKKAALLAKQDRGLQAFATEFSDPKFSTDKNFMVGGTAYRVDFFDPAQGITFVRKDNWWGDKAVAANPMLQSYAKKMVFKLVKAEDVTINMLQAGDLDLATSIAPSKFIELQNDENLKARYDFVTHWVAQYNRVMINTRDPLLSDRRVRQALAQAVDYEYFINTVQKGMATRIVGPINPKKEYYAQELPLYQYNIERAKALLAEAGWADTDNDGIADKLVNGQKTPLKLTYLTLSGTEVVELITASVQASLAKAGIQLEIKTVDIPTLTKQTQAGDFQLAASGSSLDPGLVEMYQIYHSNSLVPKGDNRTGIANAELDQLLLDIRHTSDVAKRNAAYVAAQKVLHNEVPELYLYAPVMRYIVSKDLDWKPTPLRPGFVPQHIQIKK
jgi:peptide/nickel transport system substrate-binding protein